MTAEAQKQAAGEAAATLVEAGMVVGLGTGSTANWFVRALAARGLDIVTVPTSRATADLARSLGLTVMELGDTEAIDLTVDGADEIGPGLSLIKGAGGALLREKLVWEASRRCVVIADAGKPVSMLGRFALPIEVATFGHNTTLERICEALTACGIAARPILRVSQGNEVLTDGGNVLYDVVCGQISNPAILATQLKAVTGVVDHGLFLGLAELALIGTDSGVVMQQP